MRRFIIPLFCAIVFVSAPIRVSTQNATQVKADKYYGNLNYAKAIPYYEALAKKSNPDPLIIAKLANCYRMTNNIEGAAIAYDRISSIAGLEPVIKLYYAQALMSQGDYAKAATFFNQFKADYRGENYLHYVNNLSVYYKDSANYKIKKAPFNSSYNDFSPMLLENNKVVFISARPTAKFIKYTHGWTNRRYYQMFVTEKDKDGNYKKPKLFSRTIQTHLNNGSMTFSADLTRMIFTRNFVQERIPQRGGSGEVKLHICQATYNQDKNAYLDILEFEYNDRNYNIAHPSLSKDGKMLFFSSDRPGGYGGMDIWVSLRKGDRWTEPLNLGQRVNSPGNEVFPYIHTDNTLYFSSDGLGGIGGLDVFQANLNLSAMPIGKSLNMGANFNSLADDFGVVFKSDGKTGFLSSNRDGLNLNDDIYEFEILGSVYPRIIIRGVAFDKETNAPIADAKIILTDKDSKEIDYIYSDEDGAYTFQAEYESEYMLVGEKDKYSKTQLPVSTKNVLEKKEIIADLYMSQGEADIVHTAITYVNDTSVGLPLDYGKPLTDPVKLNINVVDGASSFALAGVKVTITNKISGEVEEFFTSSSGDVQKIITGNIGDNLSYLITLSKQGYMNRERPFGYTILKPGVVNVYESMFKPEVGIDVGTSININPIYFDFDKYNIRPDAQIELDKIVEVMKQYPEMTIELRSHTDCRGSVAYNMQLSENRAQASKDYLVAKGISKRRISGKGYGESKLVNNCYCADNDELSPCSEEEHQLNRRTEFIIIKY